MLIPNNPEKLQTCSMAVQDELDKLNSEGIPYYSDQSHSVAVRAINDCIPELREYIQQTITIEAQQAVAIESDETKKGFKDIHVGGVFRSVCIQQIIELADFDGMQLESKRHDLCAVIVPRYYDPEPQDIVFGKELYVPFSGIVGFEQRES